MTVSINIYLSTNYYPHIIKKLLKRIRVSNTINPPEPLFIQLKYMILFSTLISVIMVTPKYLVTKETNR